MSQMCKMCKMCSFHGLMRNIETVPYAFLPVTKIQKLYCNYEMAICDNTKQLPAITTVLQQITAIYFQKLLAFV